MGDNLNLKDIPLIITSTTSTPETTRRDKEKRSSRKSTDSKSWKSDSQKTNDRKSPSGREYLRRKSRPVVGGSLKYELSRNHSVLSIPVKWSSVRIKGSGYDESRQSIVKCEPCNGIPNMNLDYQHVKSPTQNQMKNQIGNVSFSLYSLLSKCMSFEILSLT